MLSTHQRVWPVDVIKLRHNPFSRHKPTNLCVCCFHKPLNSAAATLKIDKTSLARRGWPNFNAIWQADAE